MSDVLTNYLRRKSASSEEIEAADIIDALTAELERRNKVIDFIVHSDDDAASIVQLTEQLRAVQGDAERLFAPHISTDELAAFHRFCDTCDDFEAGGYDVPKEKMRRLAEIGLVRWCGGSRYETTDFGGAIRDATIDDAIKAADQNSEGKRNESID